MIDRWADKNVELGLLSESIKRFFDERLFPCKVEELSNEEFIITAVLRRESSTNLTGNVKVTVRGEPNDFEVAFVAGSGSHRLARLGGLATFLGGGALVLRDLKASEELERLEKEFWLFVDRQVDSLSGRKRGN